MRRSSQNNSRARFALNFGPSPLWLPALAAIVVGAILPVLLIPVIRVTGFSEGVEEVAKGIVVWILALYSVRTCDRLGFALAFGTMFGLSESMLYANQIAQLGDWSVLWLRISLTIPLHALTALCVAWGIGRGRMWGALLGVGVAIVLHLAFNAQGF